MFDFGISDVDFIDLADYRYSITFNCGCRAVTEIAEEQYIIHSEFDPNCYQRIPYEFHAIMVACVYCHTGCDFSFAVWK